MLNFRKLKNGFSSPILEEGKQLYEQEKVLSAKIVNFDAETIRVNGTVQGNYDNHYECELEIDRYESEMVDSNCDCPYNYDCQHLAAIVFYLKNHLDEILVTFSKEADFETCETIDEKTKKILEATFKTAEDKETVRQDAQQQKELLSEYIAASEILAVSSFFRPKEDVVEDKAELLLVFSLPCTEDKKNNQCEIQLALRLPYRSKPLHVSNIKEFLNSVHYGESIYLGGRRCFFGASSFNEKDQKILDVVVEHAHFVSSTRERHQRNAHINMEVFGRMLGKLYDDITADMAVVGEGKTAVMPCLYHKTLEQPLHFSPLMATLNFELEELHMPASKVLLNPFIVIDGEKIKLEDLSIFKCANPGVVYKNVYYRFPKNIKRTHLQNISTIRDIAIPEPLFGSFAENALIELMRFASVTNQHIIDQFVTFPFSGPLEGSCDISYLDNELDAALYFNYDGVKMPASNKHLSYKQIASFVTKDGIVARNLTEEREIINKLFEGFVYDEEQGVFSAKVSKKIVEFMTETVPQNKDRVKFNCPENLLDQFIYDKTTFKLHFKESGDVGAYELDIKVDGYLKGIKMDLLWECISARKNFIELQSRPKAGRGRKKKSSVNQVPKTLVLDLEKLVPVVQIFDELGIDVIEEQQKKLPLWSLSTINTALFKGLPIEFKMTPTLRTIQKQMLGEVDMAPSGVPATIQATLRKYQTEGVHWLERLRTMHLNGILADDMGLGKTLEAIITLTQHHEKNPDAVSIVVCPTSLTYNWGEEFRKFNKKIKFLLIDGTPAQRSRLFKKIKDYDIVITSYTLLQKDIETYKKIDFDYCVLDEAQHIKNRMTRNANSAKMIKARHKLILTGTPIENSLEELWSLFDFLMPNFLSSYDRFVEKYIRNISQTKSPTNLRAKVAPFILRRLKVDVLDDLPPISNIVYHCHLSPVQKELYKSYAASAREELSQLVAKEGFNKIHIHVLATLTRLKQICCHPAIFAKEEVKEGDSSKYEMLLELLQSLIEGQHKTVIFSQYTRMLGIMREDLTARGIPYSYLDGSSKNRLGIVKEFNSNPNIPVFLVSLKAGGTGLNIVGADTVIHYDMWWNPAVENQATDRVHRIGQHKAVSAYKLITVGTIEEKILKLQESKRELVKKVITDDEEIISKLTWSDVLELLKV
jgi:SNF2 family DNA or RNA helicase